MLYVCNRQPLRSHSSITWPTLSWCPTWTHFHSFNPVHLTQHFAFLEILGASCIFSFIILARRPLFHEGTSSYPSSTSSLSTVRRSSLNRIPHSLGVPSGQSCSGWRIFRQQSRIATPRECTSILFRRLSGTNRSLVRGIFSSASTIAVRLPFFQRVTMLHPLFLCRDREN